MAFAVYYLVFGEKPWTYREEVAALKAEGKKLQLHHHVVAGLFYASVINLLLGSIVLLLRRWWGRRPRTTPLPPISAGRLPFWVFFCGVGLAVLLAGTLRMNLAQGSLWWDEIWNIKHTMSGEFRPDKRDGDTLKFREVPWDKSVYYYRKPTNHPPMAIASRLSLGAWRSATGAGRPEFDEVATRLPSLIAGLASVVAVAVLLRSWGFGAGGLVAAFLLALHPWHVRYGVDARAYSFAVLWTALGCLWLGKLIRAGGDGWRYWLLFGLNQLMLVWSLPNGIYYAFAFGMAALIFCLRQPLLPKLVPCARLVAVNAVAAMVFLFVFLPNALQIPEWGKVNDHHYLSPQVVKNVGTELAFGMEISGHQGVGAQGLTSFAQEIGARPLLAWITIGLGGAALLVGTWALWRHAPRRAQLFLWIGVGAGLSILVTWSLHQHFYHRYVVAYLIIPLVALVGIGAVELGRLFAGAGRTKWLALLSALLVLGSFGAFTRSQRVVLSTRSYAPFREVAEFVSRESKLHPITVIGYGLGGRVFQIYYPGSKFADTLEELDVALLDTESDGAPTFVICGYERFNLTNPTSADGAAKVLESGLFEEVAAFGGIEPMFYFRVMSLKEG
ncbi:MAG: hypothetical protein ACR2RV_26720 [Verrucomicrobiales bacterium]